MKKFLIVLISIFLLASAGLWSVGLSPTDLKANLDVGTGMGAKLACSGRYVSGFDPTQISEDLASYSAATDLLDFSYDDQARTVSVSLLGLGATSAQFRPGLGCTLDIGDTTPLNRLQIPARTTSPQVTPPWPRGALVTTLNSTLQNRVSEILADDNHRGLETRALVAVQGGQIVAEAYAEGISPETQLLGWSMGKSLVAILMGHLALHEELAVTETKLFPEWLADDRASVSVEHLLHMSSGLDFSEIYAPGSDATHMLFTAESASAVAKGSLLAHTPGSHFSYSSGTTNLLSELFVERVGGTQAAVDRLYQNVLDPLGMHHTTVELDPNGVFVGSSYVYSSARDWARLGLLSLNNGELNSTRITSEDWFRRTQLPNASSNETRYGYQYWLNGSPGNQRWANLPQDAYAMMGNRAQVVMMIPSLDIVLVRLGWTAGAYPTNENFAAIINALL